MPEPRKPSLVGPGGRFGGGRAGPGLLLAASLLAASLLMTSLPVRAAEAAPLAADPALEARVMQVAHELRCLVCQNQTIADSNAALAVDLRQQVRERLQRGEPPAQILTFMTERYGDYVLYRPPLKAGTLALWLGPFVLLLVALACLGVAIRQRRACAEPAGLSDADAERARRLLAPVQQGALRGARR